MMFLRKIFSSDNKLAWALIDLAIVIIGVYCAFLIQSYAQLDKNKREQERVLSATKFELEIFRYRMYQTSLGMLSDAEDMLKIQSEGRYNDFSNYRFIEPQYDYQTIQYALNLENTEIVDFELYNALQSIFVTVKRIEHAERLLTQTSQKYKTIPPALGKDTETYQLMYRENQDNFRRFITLIRDRGQISGRIAEASANALPLINDVLGSERAREIEKEIIFNNIDEVNNEEEAVYLVGQLFPDFTEEEVRQFYKEATAGQTK